MSQQSSAIVMFRALVMMVCLIAIPLAALFGTSLPDAFKALKEGRWPALMGVAHASTPAANPSEEPPKFEPSGPLVATGAAATLAPGGRVDEFALAQAPKPAAFTPTQPTLAIPAAAPIVQGSTPDSRQQEVPAVVPVGYVAPVQPQASPTVSGVGVNPAAPPAMRPLDADVQPVAEKTVDPFVSIQNSLRQQGATYYLLEAWGGQQPSYRFYCKMSIGGNPNYTHPFEAVDADPLRAMSLVLQQVEAWRAGR